MIRQLLPLAMALLACTPGHYNAAGETETGDSEAEFRASDPIACVDLQAGTCRIEQIGPCTPLEIDSCDTSYSPSACYMPGANCVVSWPDKQCPVGWFDACKYFSGP